MEIIALVGTLGGFIAPLIIGGYGTLGLSKFGRQAVADPIGDHFKRLDKSMRKTIIVSPGLPLAARIAAGKYGWTNSSITEANFPHDPTSVGEWEWKLFHFGRFIWSEDAVAAMIADGWRPALIEHLLAFGAKNPDEQRKHPIISLVSSFTVGGDRRVPELRDGGTERDLGLNYWFGGWGDRYRFLAVRKKV